MSSQPHPRFSIERSGDTVVVGMSGDWDEQTAVDFGTAITQFFDTVDEPVDFVVDMGAMTDCRILARGRLADTHLRLKPRLRRSAYLSDRPRLRGVALWIIHVADDANAKAVRDRKLAEAWLEKSVGRLQSAKDRLLATGGGGSNA